MTLALENTTDGAEARAADLAARYGHLNGLPLLKVLLTEEMPGEIALVSSFGAESALLLAMAAEVDPAVPVIFLDTGKLFGETLRYRDRLIALLGLTNVTTYRPTAAEEAEHDPDGVLWRDDPDACCGFRKVEPLERALAGFSGWITGRKRFQGSTRAALPTIEAGEGRLKINPLATWSAKEIAAEFKRRDLPPHPLVADGFLSIGCVPCTARATPGSDARSGRWAGMAKTECGIHLSRNKIKRADPAGKRLRALENGSIYALREAFAQIDRLALIWSGDESGNVLIRLARKAFYGRVPFPVVHLDTGAESPTLARFRERCAREWGLDFRVEASPPPSTEIGIDLMPEAFGAAHRHAALDAVLAREKLRGVLLADRGGEPSAEFWNRFDLRAAPGGHTRVYPLSGWSDGDIARYVKAEAVSVPARAAPTAEISFSSSSSAHL